MTSRSCLKSFSGLSSHKMLPEIIINNRLWNVGGVFSSSLFFLVWRLCCSSGNVVLTVRPDVPDGSRLRGTERVTRCEGTASCWFSLTLLSSSCFSFTCLWCPSAAFICLWGLRGLSVVRWEGNRFVYLADLRMFSVGLRCVYHVCGEVRQMCEDAFRVSLSWLQIFVGYFKNLHFLLCSVCLSCLCCSLSSAGVRPVLIGFTCILFIFFSLVSVCLSVSVSFGMWCVPAFFFLAPILFFIAGASEHLHCTALWWRGIKQLESQIYPLGVGGDPIRAGTRVNIEQLFTVWTAEGETLVL